MRKLFCLSCVLLLVLPALAVDEVTVQQLKEKLAAASTLPDKKLASKISDLRLTERLSTTALESLTRQLRGEKSRMALLAIADASAFLAPPSGETPSDPAPDSKVQGEILSRAVDFVAKETERLPNFITTRTTTRFQDTKNIPYANIPQYFTPGVFHFLDRKSTQVRYIGWMEADEEQHWGGSHGPPGWVVEDPESAATFRPSRMGLSTRGIFGQLLVDVTHDILESKIGWSRWEESAAGRVAVFRFVVDKESSTYYVKYCCFQRPGGGMSEFETVPPYHGEIAIEPSTGKVVRLAITGDLDEEDPISKASIALEYGPIEIAGKTYFLPVKGVSMMLARFEHVASWTQTNYSVNRTVDKFNVMAVNDMLFDHYQVFRGDIRILPEPATPAPAQ